MVPLCCSSNCRNGRLLSPLCVYCPESRLYLSMTSSDHPTGKSQCFSIIPKFPQHNRKWDLKSSRSILCSYTLLKIHHFTNNLTCEVGLLRYPQASHPTPAGDTSRTVLRRRDAANEDTVSA